MDKMSREALMKQLQVQSFVIDDIKLYLDTHPTDRNALDYYKKFKKLRDETYREFTMRYGPISAENVYVEDSWAWVETPWPWERWS